MSDGVEQETQRRPQNQTNKDAPKEHTTIGHLSQTSVWAYTFEYGFGGILIGVGVGLLSLSNVHFVIALLILVIGIVVFSIGTTTHYVAAKQADRGAGLVVSGSSGKMISFAEIILFFIGWLVLVSGIVVLIALVIVHL